MSDYQEIADRLHPLETQTLLPFRSHENITQEELMSLSALSTSQLRTAVEWLLLKELILIHESGKEEYVSLTKRGHALVLAGLPAARLLRALAGTAEKKAPVRELPALVGLDASEINPEMGLLKKEGLVEVKEGVLILQNEAAIASYEEREALLRRIKEQEKTHIASLSKAEEKEVRDGFVKRSPEKGAYRIDEKPLVNYELTAKGKEILPFLRERTVVNQLTPAMLASGKWKESEFRKYDISLNPPRLYPGKKHPYRQFLDNVRATLVALGFEEMTGPVVETEFWDMDALFMPQFHSARNIHDVYYVKDPHHAESIDEPFLSQVAECHKKGVKEGVAGWNYEFDREKTRRLILRSQGTALSARTLAAGPGIPGKYFGIARCFRYDQIDATHGTDFFQVEGIVVDPAITFKKLLGLLALFAREIAKAEEIRFAPAYFPFTEPSVELHAKHPRLGWMELGGAGIFRPEVTEPLNVNVPVIAWGLGVDRMAMLSLGINDIRQLFTHDLDIVRQAKVVY
jgi:phenylalanyl-tRNA synthetase alpha chain